MVWSISVCKSVTVMVIKSVSEFHIKSGYASRTEAVYFDERPYSQSEIVHQPDAYTLAGYLAKRIGADTIIDVGCGSARKLMTLDGFRKVGVDFGLNLDHCKRSFPDETWLEADLECARDLAIDDDTIARSVVICADVIEQLVDPTCLLALLSRLGERACAVIVTTPERDLVRGVDDMGPPANPAHIREWSLGEFEGLLRTSGLEPTFIGLTVNNNQNLEKKTILAIADRCGPIRALAVPDDFRPLALIATYNDRDIVLQTTAKLLDDGIDVHVLDNWSDDGTFEMLQAMGTARRGLVVERFPEASPARYYEWAAILDMKDRIAQRHSGRWIIHQDSDEIRGAPWPMGSLREGIYVADRMGFNAIDFTVCDFRPVDDRFSEGADPETAMLHFEFGKRPGHFVQTKAWRQGGQSVGLSASGGHQAKFEDRRIFPYKFVLKHYPLRSPQQARRKVFADRRERFSPDERAAGWHFQYDHWKPDDRFLWDRNDLHEFDETRTRREFLVELISGIGIVR